MNENGHTIRGAFTRPKQPEKSDGGLTRGLEDLGYVVGEIANDFNDLLTGILGYVARLKTLIPEDDQKFQTANAIEISARRAVELTHRIIRHSPKDTPKPRLFQINPIVEKAADKLSAAADNVRIITELQTPPGPIMGDSKMLLRALFHLGRNAIEAMPSGGLLTFSTHPFFSDGTTTFDGFPVPEGGYVSIVVSDTGCGIPESLREKVFDCFFTTKTEGTGIGLTLTARCVRKHVGFLRVENREDGVTFEILLPTKMSLA